ncbi:hypothetical protein MA20_11600 [Bradyrhizobium japonicum]|uniref:Uncharacterized protein n=1 Tax=Bradyrhizobium japonicum TaxID=375 RepID=A0A0A3XYT2_BRAJP|nr:hypothetical protein MA20_11600 [Bradyrhizobium japonicum]
MMIMKIKCKLVPEMIVRTCCRVEKMLLTVTRQIGPNTQSSFSDDLRKPCRALTHDHLPCRQPWKNNSRDNGFQGITCKGGDPISAAMVAKGRQETRDGASAR